MTNIENNAVISQFGLDTQQTLADGSRLSLQEVVRFLPEQRLVCKALWNEQVVYVKCFIGGRATQHAKRDVAGASALTAAGIDTPALLYQQIESALCVLIYEAITPSENVEVAWQALDQKARLKLAHAVVQVIAQHHNARLLQTDMHLKNFLLKGDEVYTLDGDGIRQFSVLNHTQAVENLCVLLSKFDVLEIEAWLPRLIETYQQARTNSPDVGNIKLAINSHRYKATSQYADSKVFRQCSDVKVSQNQQQFTAISSQFLHVEMPQDSQALDVLVDSQTRLKSGNTCTVTLANIGGVKVVIKRYNIKNFTHRLGRLFRSTRASASWANAHRLTLLGLPTPKPIALVEQRWFGLRGKAYFLSEYVEAPDVAEFFATTKGKALRAKAVKQIVQLFYRLYLLDISHGDMKATNIKMLDTNPMLIDLDSMQQHKHSQLSVHARDIQRFMQNWKDQPSLYNAFVKVFKVVYAEHAPLQAAQILE